MAQNRNLQILGLAKKAGLLSIGEESAGAAARSGQAKLVISASDASERSVRNARINAEAGFAAYTAVPYTKFELGNVTGRGSPGTIAFLDTGLAARFLKGLAETEPESFRKLWEDLNKTTKHADRHAKLTPVSKYTPSGKRRTMQ